MGMNSNIFDFIKIGVIASGGDPNGKGDHPSDESSNQKVILPGEHDPKNVKQEHLAFSPMIHSPTQVSQQSFQGVMDPGSLVYFLKMPGQTQGLILGQANDLVNYSKGAGGGGGKNLLQAQYFQDLFDREIGVHIPPNIEEGEEKGAKVRKVKDKGDIHKHSLLKGLSSHGASSQIAGYKLPQLNNIPTAVQENQGIMTGDMMNMLPGNIMSLGSMFQGLMGSGGATGGGGGGGGAGAGLGSGTNVTGSVSFAPVTGSVANTYVAETGLTRMDTILSNLKPELQDALKSISLLVQGMESEGSNSSFTCSSVVHAETYLNNAQDLFSQCSSISDLMNVIQRLQTDTTLFGLEKLPPIVVNTATTWGVSNQIVYANGYVNHVYSNTQTANVQSDFNNTMSSPAGAPSGSAGGGNMFGGSAGKLMEMLKRLPTGQEDIGKQLMNGINNGDPKELMENVIKKATGGSNPLSFLSSL